jgi:CheY-like chemotaxis protein
MALPLLPLFHPAGRRRFLLVVDSDVEKLFHTATLLQRFQYNIWTAKSAAEALELAAVAVPALIITAQFLDDQPALKLIQQLKRISGLGAVPIVVLTGRPIPQMSGTASWRERSPASPCRSRRKTSTGWCRWPSNPCRA